MPKLSTIILLLLAGIALGLVLRKRSLPDGEGKNPFEEQTRKKNENKQKILALLGQQKSLANNDVEGFLNVSDATATRYLDELEKGGLVKQLGQTGKHVRYTLRDSEK